MAGRERNHAAAPGDGPQRYLAPRALERFLAERPVDALLACSADSVFAASGHRTWLDEKMQAWMSSPAGDDTPRAGYAVAAPGARLGLVANAVVRADAEAAAPDHLVLYGRAQACRTPEQALAALLAEMGLARASLACEAQALGPVAGPAVRAAAPGCTFVDGSLAWRQLKSFKSEAAIARLRTVAELTERALAESLPLWRERPAYQAARQRYQVALAHGGAEFDHFAWGMPGGGVSAGRLAPAGPGAGTLFFDAGARLHGFYSDTGMTLAHGPLAARDAQRYADALGALQAGRAQLAAGRPASDAWRAMQAALGDPALVAQGHGLGTSIREWPFLGAATGERLADGTGGHRADAILAEGMVVNLEVGGHWPDGASVQVEQTFVVGADGPRLLAAQPRDGPFRPGAAG